MTRSVHVVPHTHWDREWYDPFPTFRMRLVELLDELLPRLEQDGVAHFQLDGQMALVDDYLAVRPDAAERLRTLNSSGRVSMGPWYVLPDEFLVSGETLVRDLQLGIRTAERFGGAMQIGYLPDMFGHIAAMPQLLNLFGMRDAVVWRGVPLAVEAPAFWWDAPDGSRVRAEYLSSGYGNGSDMPPDASTLRDRIDMFVGISGQLVGERVLWMAGMDHEVPPAHLSRVVDEMNAAEAARSSDAAGERYELQVESLATYLAEAPVDDLPVVEGELRSGARANLLMGVTSNRVDVKVAAAVAERTLERHAEPLVALWATEPSRWSTLLDLAWLEVIRNAAHDSICACSHDEVVDAVLHRYAEATGTAVAVAGRAIEDATGSFHESGLHLINTRARSRSEVVEIEIAGPTDADAADADDTRFQVLSERPAVEEMFRNGATDAPIVVARELIFEQPQTVAVRFEERDADLAVHLLPVEEDGALSPTDALGEVGRRCEADPELIVTTVLHRLEPTRRVLAMSGEVPGLGWSRWAATAPTHPVRATDAPMGLDNGLVSVTVDAPDGTFSVNGVAGFGRLVDDGDAGDSYNWCPPESNVIVDEPTSVEVTLDESGPLRGRITITTRYEIPARVEQRDDDTWARVGESELEVVTVVELRADDDAVQVTSTFENRARDHRLRVHLPLPQRATRSMAECAFTVVERGLTAEGGPNEWGVPTFPSRRFVSAGGLTVTHEGLCEYELVGLDGDPDATDTTAGALALTLVRATGWLSRGPMASRPLPAGPENEIEGAQSLSVHSLRYALRFDAPEDGPVEAYAFADRTWSPLIAVDAPGGGHLPAEGSHLDVQGVEVDAVLREGEHLVVRGHEAAGRPGTLTITGRTGEVVDLLGNRLEAFDGTIALRPHQIVTVRLDD